MGFEYFLSALFPLSSEQSLGKETSRNVTPSLPRQHQTGARLSSGRFPAFLTYQQTQALFETKPHQNTPYYFLEKIQESELQENADVSTGLTSGECRYQPHLRESYKKAQKCPFLFQKANLA